MYPGSYLVPTISRVSQLIYNNTLEFSFPPPSTNLTLKVEPNLGEELHLDLSCVIDDEFIVVESVPLHLGHLGRQQQQILSGGES